MGVKIRSLLSYASKSLEDEFKNKEVKIAVDLLPLIHKYFYFDLSSDVLNRGSKDTELVRTSHIYGVLNFIKQLNKYGIHPVFCVDTAQTRLKSEEAQRRASNLSQMILNLELKYMDEVNDEEKRKALALLSGPKKQDKLRLIQILTLLGYEVYSFPGVEGQKLCAYLMTSGKVDSCHTPDTDMCLYGVNAISHFDFKNKSFMVLDTQRTKKQNQWTQTELVYVAIAAGTDFSKGIPGVGPKKAAKMIKEDFFAFESLLYDKIPSFDLIRDYFLKQDSLVRTYVDLKTSPQKNVQKVRTILKDLHFTERTINSLLAHIT